MRAKPATQGADQSFYKEARDRVTRMPGIVSAAWSSNMPLWARAVNGLQVEVPPGAVEK